MIRQEGDLPLSIKKNVSSHSFVPNVIDHLISIFLNLRFVEESSLEITFWAKCKYILNFDHFCLHVCVFIRVAEAWIRVSARLAEDCDELVQGLSVEEFSTRSYLRRGFWFSIGDLKLLQVVFLVTRYEVCDGPQDEDIKSAHD